MNRCNSLFQHFCIRYFAVCLIVTYASTGGHLFCALCHSAHTLVHAERHCGHFSCQSPEVLPPPYCCSETCEGHPCDTGELPIVILQRSNDEPVNPLAVSCDVFYFVVSVEYPPGQIGFQDTITFHSSAPALRLYLFYEVLMI